jgi:enoyl-CoA hydratase
MSDTVLCDIHDGIATLTLNRPEKLNAISYELADALLMQLDRLEVDDCVGALILKGAGDKAFCAGADIHEFYESVKRGPLTAVRDFVRRGQSLTARVEAFCKPIVVAVDGLAYGGGCEITEAAHLAVASDKASFAKPEILLGMPPTFGGTQRLPRLAGRKRALEHLLTGEPFGPARALELGLVNAIVPGDQLMYEARALAKRITRHSPLTVAAIITAVTRGLNMSISEGLLSEAEQFAKMVPTCDLSRALDAWIHRRSSSERGI